MSGSTSVDVAEEPRRGLSAPADEHMPVELPRISDYLHHYAALQPAAEAAVLDTQRLSYGGLARLVSDCARSLIEEGVSKGDRVAMLCTPRPEFLAVFLATVEIGAIWVGLNPRHQLEEFDHVLRDCTPKILFALPEFEGRDYRDDIAELIRRNPAIQTLITVGGAPSGSESFAAFTARGTELDDAARQAARDCVTADDIALIVYTSGTTGRPKGAMLRHRGLVHCSRIQADHWPSDNLRIVNNLPIDHVGCVGDISCYALVLGGAIVFMERFDPSALLDVIEHEGINWLLQAPTMYALTVAVPDFDSRDLSSLDWVVWGGAAMSRDLIRKFRSLDVKLVTSYGMTETTGSVTYTDVDDDDDALVHTVGRPDPRYELRIADATGRRCRPGTQGEVQLRGDFLMAGYWHQREATQNAFTPDGWLHTGDAAVELPDGRIQLVGRLVEMFKSGGYNVYPREVELVLERHPNVAMCAVLAAKDPLYSEVGHAFVIRVPGSQVTSTELEAWCRGRMANYKRPKHIEVRDDLPMLPIGKIDKTALRRRLADHEVRSGDPLGVPPPTG